MNGQHETGPVTLEVTASGGTESGKKGPAGRTTWTKPGGWRPEPDRLAARIDVYQENIILKVYRKEETMVRAVSEKDLADLFARDVEYGTGLLPPGALWHRSSHARNETALWRPPQVWPVAVQTEPFQPPLRLRLPMPGLVFVCSPAAAPKAFAAKSRPTSGSDTLYQIPAFNVFRGGQVCQGSHRFPEDISEIPESFFQSRFSQTGNHHGRSAKYPQDLMKLWEELDGQERYPEEDLVPHGTVQEELSK